MSEEYGRPSVKAQIIAMHEPTGGIALADLDGA